MKEGSLIKIQHFGQWSGKIGILIGVVKRVGYTDSYVVQIPNYTYEIGLALEQIEVLCESR